MGGMKQIKGLSRDEAWAASLAGTVLHTTNGGGTWNIVDLPEDVPITLVNRMNAIGCRSPQNDVGPVSYKLMSNANIWIVDEGGGNQGMIHSLYNGELWRKEDVPLYNKYRIMRITLYFKDYWFSFIRWYEYMFEVV